MTTETLRPSEIRRLGLEALARELGPVGMVRFLQQFETGAGDYTKDRDLWLKSASVTDIVKEIKGKRKKK